MGNISRPSFESSWAHDSEQRCPRRQWDSQHKKQVCSLYICSVNSNAASCSCRWCRKKIERQDKSEVEEFWFNSEGVKKEKHLNEEANEKDAGAKQEVNLKDEQDEKDAGAKGRTTTPEG